MKTIKLLFLIIVLFGSITSGSVWARGGHGGGHFGGGHHFGGHHFGGHHFGSYGFRWGLGLGYGLGYGRYWPYYGGYYSTYYCGYDGCYPPAVYIQRRTVRKQLQDHRPAIGTTAAIQKVIIHKSKSFLTAGYQLLRG